MVTRTNIPHTQAPRATGFADAERAVVARRSELVARFERSPAADRIFAVDRMVRDDVLRPDDEDAVLEAQAKVRASWAAARAAKITGASLAQKRHELDLMVAERALWRVLSDRGLFDTLFAVSEGYLCVVPRSPAEMSFRGLLQHRDVARRAQLHILAPIIEAA